ncbi:hypothetical protein [Actinoplanes palleronii]|nr:hypothetical protein [Actinoplanes palleronii]
MRFEHPERRGWRDHRAELRSALTGEQLPMIGLPGTAGGWIAGWDTSADVLTAVTVKYGEPGSWLSVETAVASSGSSLRETLEEQLRLAGVRFADVTWDESEAAVTVDGRSLTAQVLHAGEDWWAARVVLGASAVAQLAPEFRSAPPAAGQVGLEVGLLAYRKGFEPRLGALLPGEIAEMLNAPMPDLERWAPARPVAGPALPDGEPHRVLVDIVLQQAIEQQTWMAEGGPMPQLPASWGSLWTSVVKRQSDLAGQSEDAAQSAVSDMLSQLAALQREAAWFREDTALRHRAISETLLFVTGLATDVPSRPAQEAWRERQGTRIPTTRPDAVLAAGDHWLTAWTTWTTHP